MKFSSQTLLGPNGRRTRSGQLRLLKNGAEAHEFTRDGALHADLVMLARLSLALTRARAVPLAA